MTNSVKNKSKLLSQERRNQIFAFCLGIFLFSIPWQSRISNIGLIILGIGYLVAFNKRIFQDVLASKVWQLLALNFLWFLIGLFFTYVEQLSPYSERIGKYLLVVILPFLMAPAAYLSKRQIYWALGAFVISILTILIGSYYIAFLSQASEFSRALNYSTFLLNSFDFHPAYIAMFTVFSIFLCVEALVAEQNKVFRYALGILALLCFVSLFVIQARMPLIALLIIFPYYIFALQKSFGGLSKGKFLLRGILVLAVIVTVWLWADKQSALLIKERLIGSFYNSLNIRLETWNCSWQVFSSGSWWLGVGSGNEQLLLNECYYERFLTRHFYSAFNVHSDMLLILLRNGLIGLALWFVFLYYFTKNCYKHKFSLGIIFILLFVISGITEAYLSRIWGSLFFGAGIGLSMAYRRKILILKPEKI